MEESLQGLSEAQVKERRAKGLTNAVAFKTGRSYLQILQKNAFTFINTILFVISALLVLMGQPEDALVTAGLVLLNVVVGVYQEAQAKYKLDRLALQVRARASVMRQGTETAVDPEEIVLDDLLICRPGDQILADGQIVGEARISVDESILTGESDRIVKLPGDHVYSGSFCISGTALYRAEKVGAENQINQLTRAARLFRHEKTPLQRNIDTIIRVLVILVTLLGVLLGVSTILAQMPVVEYLRIAAVIVALVPQGLFFMTTVSYAMGMLRVAGSGALIQQANAVESTSHVDLLCLDKTGTLTTNQLELSEVFPLDEQRMEREALIPALGKFAASSSSKDRTITAILDAYPAEVQQVLDEVPFASEYKWSALRYEKDANAVHVLGAPEVLAGSISSRDKILGQVADWTRQGKRVLLFCNCPTNVSISAADGQPRLPPELEPLGLVIFREELRPDARQTLEHFRKLGIRIKFISGDHPETVAALAKQVGVTTEGMASGLDLLSMDADQLEQAALETTIFGRITPQQKETLIDIYNQQGYYAAMIGDGVNDILPLKRAQLGIAMQSGASATRSIADIVLLQDSFSALPIALREGQRIVRGMLDVIRLLLTRTFYVFLLIVATQIAGAPFPVTPRHNALIALLTVGIPILAIAAWAKPGKQPGNMLRSTLRFVFPAAVSIALVVTGIYLVYLGMTGKATLARSALTTASIFSGLLLLPFVEPPNPWWVAGDEFSGDLRPSLLAVGMLALFLGVMLVPGVRNFFELELLGGWDYLIIAGLISAWGLMQRTIWRGRVFERLLGLEWE